MLHFSNAEVGLAGSAYLAGAVLGALFFGWLDRPARPQEAVLHHARALPARHGGHGVLVEPVELRAVPLPDRRRHRRRVRGDQLDHPGADPGARARLDRPRHQRQLLGRRGARRGRRRSCCSIRRCCRPDIGWRAAFCIGAVLGARDLPDAPVAAGKPALADDARPRATRPRRSSPDIEAALRAPRAHGSPTGRFRTIRLRARTPHAACARCAARCSDVHRQRTLVGLALMAAQAFFYNAIFFTYALVLTDFYGIRADHVGWYILPFAAGNFLGPAAARAAVRHARAPADDRLHLRDLGRAAGGHRLSVRAGSAHARRS